MKVNSENNTKHCKKTTRLFKGKNKRALILIPAILLLICTLIIFVAASRATALPASNAGTLNANTISTMSGSSNGLSLNGNLTTNGNSTLNGSLTLTNAQNVTLGSPLIQSGALNIIADKIEIGKPSNQNGTIIMNGTALNPTTVDLYGNILIGDPTTTKGMLMNVTEYYQRVESYGPGYIGSIGNNQTLPVNSSTCVRVLQGTLYQNLTKTSIAAIINNTQATVLGIPLDLSGTGGVANVTDLLGGFQLVLNSNCLWWNQSIIFEAWGGPGGWFGMSSGYINMTDAHIHMVSNGTIYYNFLNTSTAAGITVTPGANVFTKAEMDLVTQTQNITGLGSTYITNGSMSMEGSTILPQQQIINGILNFEGDMILQNGNMTIQGTFDVGGGNFIEGPAILDGSLNINNGMMTGAGTISVSAGGYLQTVGDTRISNGGLSVQNGDMIMNSSGTYIGTDTLITGDLAMSGNVVNSGALTMSGTFTLLIPMSMTGSIVTIGISSMGSLGAITGVLNVLGNIVMSGPTVIIGVNNILGSMTVTSSGASIIGVSGLTGAVFTSSTPTIMDQSILEIPSGSLMGLSVSNIGILYSPLALLALGIMAIGSIFVLVRTIYIGYQDRRMLAQLPGVMLIMMREQFARLRKAFGGSSSGSKSEANTKKRSKK